MDMPVNTAAPQHMLELKRSFTAPVAKIWRCWTEPELLAQWFCPRPWRATGIRLDPKPGGEFFCVIEGPDGERFENPGVFLAVEPQRRLVTTDALQPGWIPTGSAFMVAHVLFEPAADSGTAYTARAMHWSEESLRKHEEMGFHEGWAAAADQLEDLARSI